MSSWRAVGEGGDRRSAASSITFRAAGCRGDCWHRAAGPARRIFSRRSASATSAPGRPAARRPVFFSSWPRDGTLPVKRPGAGRVDSRHDRRAGPSRARRPFQWILGREVSAWAVPSTLVTTRDPERGADGWLPLRALRGTPRRGRCCPARRRLPTTPSLPAELEHDAGASATYFLMTSRSSTTSLEGRVAAIALRELGHRVALHAVYRAPRSTAVRPRRHLAQPRPAGAAADGRINIMQDRGSIRDVPARIEPALTLRCPHETSPPVRSWLALTHPEIGPIPVRRWGRRCGRCSRRNASGGYLASRERGPLDGGDPHCTRRHSSAATSARRENVVVGWGTPSVDRSARTSTPTLLRHFERVSLDAPPRVLGPTRRDGSALG
jgi:hypothetical protein